MGYTLRETLYGFRRSPFMGILAIIIIGFSFYAVGIFALVAINVNEVVERFRSKVEIVAYLVDDAKKDDIEFLQMSLETRDEIAQVEQVTKDMALKKFRENLRTDPELLEDLEINPLPASLEIKLKNGYRSGAPLIAIANELGNYPFIEEVQYGYEWVEKLDLVVAWAYLLGLAVGIGIGATALVVISSTIKIVVHDRREEISIMKLVGATDGFIKRPFAVDGLIKGSLGGVLAVALVFLTYHTIELEHFQVIFFTREQLLIGVLAAVILGISANLFFLKRYLRGL